MKMTGQDFRPQLASLSVALSLVLLAPCAFAQDAVTNMGGFAAIIDNPGYLFPFELPYETPGMIFWPQDVWFFDPSLTNALAAVTNYPAQTQNGVNVWPLRLVQAADTGTMTLQYVGALTNTVLMQMAAPTNFVAYQQYTNVLSLWCMLFTGEPRTTPYTNLVADGYTFLEPPVVEMDAWGIRISDETAYLTNGVSTNQTQGAQEGTNGLWWISDNDVSCVITEETMPFEIVAAAMQTNGFSLTWAPTCDDQIYEVQYASSLPATPWMDLAWMWGQDGYMAYTDTNALSLTQNFYQVARLDPDALNNGIPLWWAVEFGLDPLDPNLAYEDPDNSFWSNLADYQNGIDPTNADDALPLTFAINGGTNPVSSTQLNIELATGIVADYVVIAEDVFFTNPVTNAFSSSFEYTLQSNVDGLHTLYLQLLKTNGIASAPFAATVQVEQGAPTIWISSPTNGTVTGQQQIDIQGFAGDANTNGSAPLQVTVNGGFVSDRDTNGNWWSAQDLTPGTNTFLAVATGVAGLTATSSVSIVYDPTLATNTPNFTLDVTNTVTVGSNTTTIAVSGSIDDSNATVQIIVLDAFDNTITNATVGAAVNGTNWWADVPVLAGSNVVVVSAQNSASTPATNSFMTIQNPNVFLEITSPADGVSVNATNVTVTGAASTNFNGTITVNGVTASTSAGANGITFSAVVPINSVDANVVEVDATGSDGSSATTRETCYGYELLAFHIEFHQSFADSTVANVENVIGDWVPSHGDTYHVHVDSESSLYGFHTSDWDYWGCSFTCSSPDSGDVCLNIYGYPGGVDEGDYNYSGPSEVGSYDSQFTVIKHAPVNEEQLVVFHFTSLQYDVCCVDGMAFDPSQITFRGASGFWYIDQNGQTNGVAFLIKVQTNTPFTIQASDFQFPPIANAGGTSHNMLFTGFGNSTVKLNVQVVGQGCNKPDLNQAATKLALSYSGPQINTKLAAMQQTCQNAGSFSVYVYQGHAGLTNGQPQVAAYTGKICNVTTNCPAGVPTYDAPLLCFIPITSWLADAYYLTTSASPSMVNDFATGKGMPPLVVIMGCESGTSWPPGFTQAGAKVVVYSGGEGEASTASAAIGAFFNTLASSPSSTIDQALSAANAIIDIYNMHPAAIGPMSDMTAVYGSGASGASTFADIIKP